MDEGRGADEGPVQVLDAAVVVEGPGLGDRFRLPLLGKVGRVQQPLAGRDLQAAGSADDQEPAETCFTQPLDQPRCDVGECVARSPDSIPRPRRSDTPQPPAGSKGRSGSPTAAELNADDSARALCHHETGSLAPLPARARTGLIREGSGCSRRHE